MKLNFIVIDLFLALVTLSLMPSCSSENDPFVLQKEQEELIGKGLDFSYEGASQTVSFEVQDDADWSSSILDDATNVVPDWCTITNGEQNGTKNIHVDCKENDSEKPRSAVILIQSGSHTLKVNVRQEAKPTIHFSQAEYSLPKDGGDLKIPFTYNTSFETEVTYYAADSHYNWTDKVEVNTTSANGILNYHLGANNGLGRVCKIAFNKGGVTLASVLIKQSPDNSVFTPNMSISTLSNFAGSIASMGSLGIILGEDNVEGWKKVKSLQITGDLYYKDLLFLKKFTGAGDFTNRQEMASSPKTLDLRTVETIYSADPESDSYGWQQHGKNIIPDKLFESATALSSIFLPTSLEKIGSYAFHDCTSLNYVEIPYTVQSIGNHAFFGCAKLTDIKTFSSNELQEIGQMAFDTGIECGYFYLSAELKTLDMYSFQGFRTKKLYAPWNEEESLPSVTFPTALYQNCTLVVPKGSLATYRETGNWGKFKNIIEAD